MNKCVNDLERGLTKHVLRSLKKSFTPFRDDLLEGQSKQKTAAKALLNTQKSELQKKFDDWKNETVFKKNMNKNLQNA